MPSFGSQLRAWAEKTEESLETVDRAFKLSLFGMVVRNTRVADPLSWKRPDPTYVGGTMRGGWQVSTGTIPAGRTGVLNTGAALPSVQAQKVQPFSDTFLTNNVPYAEFYEEKDAMVGRAIADARRTLEREVAKVAR